MGRRPCLSPAVPGDLQRTEGPVAQRRHPSGAAGSRRVPVSPRSHRRDGLGPWAGGGVWGGGTTEPWRGKMKAGDAEGEVGQSAGLSRQAQLCVLRAAPAVPAASPWAAAAGGGELGGGGVRGLRAGCCPTSVLRDGTEQRGDVSVPCCPCGDAVVRMVCAMGWDGMGKGRGGFPARVAQRGHPRFGDDVGTAPRAVAWLRVRLCAAGSVACPGWGGGGGMEVSVLCGSGGGGGTAVLSGLGGD